MPELRAAENSIFSSTCFKLPAMVISLSRPLAWVVITCVQFVFIQFAYWVFCLRKDLRGSRLIYNGFLKEMPLAGADNYLGLPLSLDTGRRLRFIRLVSRKRTQVPFLSAHTYGSRKWEGLLLTLAAGDLFDENDFSFHFLIFAN